ncbi:MAG: transposase [Treponema sp.]|jgi:transposase|nr:transposase [Treponema sp.]
MPISTKPKKTTNKNMGFLKEVDAFALQQSRGNEKRLGKYQRRLSRKPKDSYREKARLKIACIHERTANFRRNFLDTLSYRLV